ncbi:hypothetical protein [Sphingobacterium lumbrici]|uniref:hypothetical protein n=1 Tax=Sphingobacterium lumbrici TaxID=2559600 RepID=UPI00112C2F51|nr:hypothetical protein [Sphingobacterium lumbrici]
MKGFEITVNSSKKTAAAVHGGFVLITLSCQYGIDITGGDDKLGISLQWEKSTLHIGDKVKIATADMEAITPAINIEDMDRQKLLAEYQNLKEFLMKEGRLK